MMETNVKLPMKTGVINNTTSKLVLEINKDRLTSILRAVFGILLLMAFIAGVAFSYSIASPMLIPLLKVGGILFLIGLIAFLSRSDRNWNTIKNKENTK